MGKITFTGNKMCYMFTFTTMLFWFVLKDASADDSVTSPCLCLEKVVDKLHNPVEYVTIRREKSLLTLIVEQRGVVRAFVRERPQERQPVFMNISDRVTTSDAVGEERGLLSLALHPRYNQSHRGRVFVYYITTATDSGWDRAVVSEFQAYDDVVDDTSERQFLHVDQPSARNNGGQLLFGDDGYLYIFTGDGVGHNASAGHAQDLQSFLGKALRIDVDRQGFESGGGRGGWARAYVYDTPSTNPFSSGHGRPEIFAFGFFNPWRCSQDSVSRGGTGAIFCGDTGSDLFEEINVVTKGRNYGWNLKEGDHCYSPANCSRIVNEGLPIYTYPYSRDWGSAVVGGFVYRGGNFSSLVGDYVFGDAVSGKIYLLREEDTKRAPQGQWSSRPWPVCPKTWCPCGARALKQPFVLAFGLDPQGELMLLMSSEFSVWRAKGVLYRAVPPAGNKHKAVTCRGAPGPELILLPLTLPLLVSIPLTLWIRYL